LLGESPRQGGRLTTQIAAIAILVSVKTSKVSSA
jgi:hypothetical protein